MVEHTFNLNIQEAEWGRFQCLRLVCLLEGSRTLELHNRNPVYKQTNKNDKQKKSQV